MSNTYFDNNVFNKGKAFIPFLTAGYPTLDATEKLILKMEEAGADLIEVGIPFQILLQKAPLFKNQANWRLKTALMLKKFLKC